MTGEELKKIRIEKGMTQVEFADIIGYSVEHLCRLERNKKPIGYRLTKLLSILHNSQYKVPEGVFKDTQEQFEQLSPKLKSNTNDT